MSLLQRYINVILGKCSNYQYIYLTVGHETFHLNFTVEKCGSNQHIEFMVGHETFHLNFTVKKCSSNQHIEFMVGQPTFLPSPTYLPKVKSYLSFFILTVNTEIAIPKSTTAYPITHASSGRISENSPFNANLAALTA